MIYNVRPAASNNIKVPIAKEKKTIAWCIKPITDVTRIGLKPLLTKYPTNPG